VGPRAGLDECEKPCPPPGFYPWTVQPVVSRYTDRVIPAHQQVCAEQLMAEDEICRTLLH